MGWPSPWLRLRMLVSQLAREHATPGRLATAVLLGVVIACTPFYGLQTILVLLLAWVLRLNRLAALAAAQVPGSVAPLTGFAAVQVGEILRHGRFLVLGLGAFSSDRVATTLWTCLLSWLLGGLVLGLLLGAALALPTYLVARAVIGGEGRGLEGSGRRRGGGGRGGKETTGSQGFDSLLRQAAGRYRRLPRFYRCYAAAKYRRDPVYRLLAARLEGAERVVDLGCGIGLLPVLLSLMPGRRQVTGVEWDGRKLEMARQATSGLTAVTLVEADIRAVAIPEADAIVFADVLHYFDLEIQERLLRAASAALLPGGQLLVRETDACAQRGARLTRLVESMAVRLGWNRGLGIHFRAAGELAADLRRLGLDVERVEAAGSGLAGNWLLCARQPVEKSSGCQALAERAQADG